MWIRKIEESVKSVQILVFFIKGEHFKGEQFKGDSFKLY